MNKQAFSGAVDRRLGSVVLSGEARARIREAVAAPAVPALAWGKRPLRLRRAVLVAVAACLILAVGASAAMGLLPGFAWGAGAGASSTAASSAAMSKDAQQPAAPAGGAAGQAMLVEDGADQMESFAVQQNEEAVSFALDGGGDSQWSAACDIDLGGTAITSLHLSSQGLTVRGQGDWAANTLPLEVELWQTDGVYVFTVEAAPVYGVPGKADFDSSALKGEALEVFYAFERPIDLASVEKLVVNGWEIFPATE